jgi:2-keto-4-pentenoate hydratase/2-oxohepta-3-ene-1,7-dioic acid hydratase in catechol pathway
MKLAIFNNYRIGLVEADAIYDVTAALPRALDSLPHQRMNWLIGNWRETLPTVLNVRRDASAQALLGVVLMPPSPSPSHIFAAPANYYKHIGELGDRAVTKMGRTAREQGFFLKAPGSLIGAGGAIALPRGSTRRFDHEAELAVIIGARARNVSQKDAMRHVFGYSCLIDVTMRIEPDGAEEERSMRKSFEGFTPLGPFIVTADEVADPQALASRLWVNGDLRQAASSCDMIVGVAELIELISSVLPLNPGDVIATGTPQGVGPFTVGDTLRIAIDGVGDMSVQVRASEALSPRPY